LPDPKTSGIDHIVVLCMENRSFDHFGMVAEGQGKQSGLTYLDDDEQPHTTHHLTEWQGCGFADPDHGYKGGRLQLNGGAVRRLPQGRQRRLRLGYYTRTICRPPPRWRQLHDLRQLVFCSILDPRIPTVLTPTRPLTDRITNTFDTSTLPTIWDRLSAAGVSRDVLLQRSCRSSAFR